jgi:hypothetical protein
MEFFYGTKSAAMRLAIQHLIRYYGSSNESHSHAPIARIGLFPFSPGGSVG